MSSTCRYPKSLSYVILDTIEKIYLAGFPLLQIVVTALPAMAAYRNSSTSGCVPTTDVPCDSSSSRLEAMEFLPLMMTSVYCAVGLIWGYLRLIFVYLHEETTYRGQLSEIQ